MDTKLALARTKHTRPTFPASICKNQLMSTWFLTVQSWGSPGYSAKELLSDDN